MATSICRNLSSSLLAKSFSPTFFGRFLTFWPDTQFLGVIGFEAVVVGITKGKLHFGPWEQIFYGEFDGNRRKRVLVKIIGE